MKFYSVYDSKVGAFSKPFVMRTNGEAVRGFTVVANDKNTDIGAHPGDFTLFEIGMFNEETAFITVYDAPISLGVAVEFVSKIE